uniref:DH domain-containing protein n=1 Tax=Anopheles epiroticus TaxID=199890 RepID=A0A182PMB7_9DIPT
MDTSIITVQAQYSFKGSNNDELCFKKGDIITLTQREEGGWWEGTLGDKTGWFPSNYVKEYAETIRPPEEIQAFRSVVFRDLLESEKAHVAELRGLTENFLEPLEASQILSSNEYTQLMCNFLEVVEMHEEFLQTLEDCNDRVGKVFLSKAPTMKKIHQFYCTAHPRAIVIVDKFREELNVFMEKQGAAKPGLLVLTTGLSKPFRRLDKYAAILQELERHMESGHPDRGDTQRSIAVYKDIASSCSATRRQKELELQILTGPVRGWQGAELSTLGDIIHMGSVAVGPEHKDRYLVLFPQTLLILSVSQRMSAFKYEGKLPLTGITVNRLEDTDLIKNAFEISGSLIDRIVAVCQGPNEANRWVELLSPKSATVEQINAGTVDMKRNVSSSAVNIPQPPPHVSVPITRVSLCAYEDNGSKRYRMYGDDFVATLPPSNYPPTAPYAELTGYFRRLFRAGELSRYVVQALLYPQVTQKYDRREVVMRRRRHKTTVRMQRRDKEAAAARTAAVNQSDNQEVLTKPLMSKEGESDRTVGQESQARERSYNSSDSSESSSCASSSCSRSRSNFERQNAVDYVDEDDDAYETITFLAGKSKNNPDSSCDGSTVYESYDEPHYTEGGSFTYKHIARKTSSCSSKEHSTSEEDDYGNDDKRSSEMIGSAAIPFLRLNDRDSVNSGEVLGCARSNVGRTSGIHTSTARLLLGDLKQQCSEQSQLSSFEHRDAHGRMACENLLNLDESMQIKHSLQQKTITEERHSMPTYFVGNRFNNSSVTEIYIPSWKEDCQGGDGQGPTATTTTNAGNNESGCTDRHSVHSSSLDIPAIIPAPDPVTAELLYNFPKASTSGDTGNDDHLQKLDNMALGCLSREQSPFRKHSINSDKKLVLNPNHHRKGKDDSPDTSRTLDARIDKKGAKPSIATGKRCRSYQYVQLSSKFNSPLEVKKLDSNNNLPADDRGTADKSVHRGADTSDHMSYRYHATGSGCADHKCQFCSFYSRGHSPHSSDSGMAGSCTISSPDGPAKFSGDFLLCDYAEQRTSGDDMDSAHSKAVHGILQDPEAPEDVVDGNVRSRSYALRPSRSSHNLGRFALVDESEFDFTDSGQYDHHNDQHPNDNSQSHGVLQGLGMKNATISGSDREDALELSERDARRYMPLLQDHTGHDRITRSRSADRVLSLFSSLDRNDGVTEPRLYSGRSRIVVNLSDRSSAAMMQRRLEQSSVPPCTAGQSPPTDRITFKTGLYAHWWKKEKLPIFVVTSNESLKLPPASGSLSRPLSPRSPCIVDSSNSRSTNSSKPTTSQAGVFPSGGNGLSHHPNISATDGAARGSGKRMSPPSATGNSHPSRSGSSSIVQHMSQHKRSQSFNHHLSYNQVQQQQQLQQQQLKQHQQNQNLLASPNSLNLNRPEANQAALNLKGFSEKANWNITNLRPAPPLRPAFLTSVVVSSTGGAGGGTGGGRSATASITGSIGGAAASCVGGGSSGGGSIVLNTSDSVHHSLSFSSSSKVSPTYEEDALVLRVIEAYCAAYQSTSRNTMHSALLPWTPCLPIRGGKLKTSKHFSSSNPQLPFTCSSLSSYLPSGGGIKNSRTHTSTNSINSSHIWREASPNSFNLYAASIATLNVPNGAHPSQQQQQQQQQQQTHKQQHHPRARYSIGGYGSTEWRSHSEELGRNVNSGPRSINTLKTAIPSTGYHNPIARSGSNYDNIFMNSNTNTPLLSRVSKQQTVWMNANQLPGGGLNHTLYQHHQHHPSPHHHRYRHRTTSRELDAVIPDRDTSPPPPAPEGGGYIGDYLPLGHSSTGTNVSLYDRRLNRSFETAQGLKRNSKISQLRRSTPQLNGDDGENDDEDTRSSLLQEDNMRDDMSRNSVSCCNKLVRQLQQDMAQVKLQITEERSQRGHLQQVLMGHLEAYGATNTTC